MEVDLAGLWDTHSPVVLEIGRKLITAAIIIIGGVIVILLSRRISQRAVTGKLHADETIASILRAIIQYGITIICLIMILDLFGVNTAGLIAVLGAAGVAVGFALKDTLSNIAAGIIILFLRPFRKGEFIECGSAIGLVQEQGLFATILRTPDGVYISAPNSSLWGVPLKNYSRNPERRMDITITVSYSDSVDTAFQVIREIIAQEPRFLKEPAAQVMVQSLGDLGTGITLRAWTLGSDYWAVYWDGMKNVKEKIQEAGLMIALPRQELHLAKKIGVAGSENLSGENFQHGNIGKKTPVSEA